MLTSGMRAQVHARRHTPAHKAALNSCLLQDIFVHSYLGLGLNEAVKALRQTVKVTQPAPPPLLAPPLQPTEPLTFAFAC